MKNKVLKVAVVIMLIMIMTMSNFIFVGMNLVAFALASGGDATNHENIKFMAYFKEEESKKFQVSSEIDRTDMKLYFSVEVKDEGYFDGVITLENSNFKFKQEIQSEYISGIDGNKITLKRVSAGNKIEIEVGIEATSQESYEANMLNKQSSVILTGDYKDSTEKNINIKAEKNVALILHVPSAIESTLTANVITNKIYKLGEENKRIVQIELISGVVNNVYPVKSTTFTLAVPDEAEHVEVIAKETSATDGNLDRALDESQYQYDNENNILKITVQNQINDGKISWKKNSKDSVIVTIILPEDKEITEQAYNINSKIELYGEEEKVLEKEASYNLVQEANAIIRTEIKNTESIYKGKIYSREEREYKTATNIEINYANLTEKNTVTERTTYITETEQKTANIEYKTTTINKVELQKILGQEGTLTIKDINGEILSFITADTPADENGNILVEYRAGIKELVIETSKAITTGIIRLYHTKVIKAEEYSKEEVTELTNIVEQAKITYNLPEERVEEYSTENRTELKETTTKAELVVVPQNLSTAVVNEKVKIAVTLRTESEQYDLYKNPTLRIKLPDQIKNIEVVNKTALYLHELQVSRFYFVNDTKELVLEMQGEQLTYNGVNNNIYIEVLANIELEDTLPSKQDVITLTYSNEKAVRYENEAKDIVPVSITGINGLVSFNKITNYDLKTNSVTSKQAEIGSTKMYSAQTEANSQIALVNNTGSNLSEVKVLGNLPVNGEITIGEYTFNNTIGATVKKAIEVSSGEGTVYYTANKNATKDIENAENGWTTNINEVTNPVLYMIVIPNMPKESNFMANYTMNIPANLQFNQNMQSTYVANYIDNTSSGISEAIPVGLETGKVSVQLSASVGGENIENNSIVRAGEVIRYTMAVTNTGSSEANNVTVKGQIPDGTVYVEPVEKAEYADPISKYYEEYANKNEVQVALGNIGIGETKTVTYEVRVKSDTKSGTATNQATVSYNGEDLLSNTISNTLEAGSVRVTVKRRTDTSVIPTQLQSIQYFIIVENITSSNVENVELKLNIPDQLRFGKLEGTDGVSIENTNTTIKSIPANTAQIYRLFTSVNEIAEAEKAFNVTATAKYENNIYRSNSYGEIGYGYNVEISMTGTHAEEYLKAGDTIDFEITVTNNSKIPLSAHNIETIIPEQLSITALEIDGQVQEEKDNYIIKILSGLGSGQSMKIKITAVVNYSLDRPEVEKISTIANLSYHEQTIKTTEPIIHYLDAIIIDGSDDPVPPVDPDDPYDPEVPDNPSINPNDPDDPDNPPVDPEDPDNPPVDPDDPDNPPVDPDDPDNPPVDPDDPDNPPVDPDDPDNPDNPTKNKYNISGKAWVDKNQDGEMNGEDTLLKDIVVKLLDIETNQFVRNDEGTKDLTVKTAEDGTYLFTNIVEGEYIVVFEYDKELYKPTIYQKDGVEESKNSNVVEKSLTVNGEEKQYATTNEIKLNTNISNINMGLLFAKKFDIQINKYISKVIVQTSKETTTYDYQNKNFARVEINAKRIIGSTILVQYTIVAKNIGDVDAYINAIVDYAPNGLKFSSELNKEWYEEEGNLHTSALANSPIAPGESKEINLILTKTKTDGTAELINNMAEIQECYNIYGILDTNSNTENKNVNENDLGSADLLVSIQTGSAFNYIILVLSMLAVIGGGVYLINKKVLHIKFDGKEVKIDEEK